MFHPSVLIILFRISRNDHYGDDTDGFLWKLWQHPAKHGTVHLLSWIGIRSHSSFRQVTWIRLLLLHRDGDHGGECDLLLHHRLLPNLSLGDGQDDAEKVRESLSLPLPFNPTSLSLSLSISFLSCVFYFN